MKTMKKFLTAICSCVFVVALALGISLNVNVKAKAATSTNVNITYACVEYTANDGTGVPKSYTLVAGLTTSSAYDTFVYVDGEKTAATVNYGNFYMDINAFDCAVGDTVLLEIPAGTYYQADATVANDVKLFLTLTNSYTDPNSGAYNNQGIFTITDASNVISTDAYSIELYRVDWAMNALNASDMYLRIVDPNHEIKSGTTTDWSNHAQYAPLGNAVTVNGAKITNNLQKAYSDEGDHKEAAYISISGASKPGDVVTFDGWFYNATYGAFRIEKTSFIYDGKSWDEENSGTYDFEVSTTSDANPQNGFYLSMAPNHIPVSTTDNGWSFVTMPAGSNYYGYYNSASAGIQLRKFSATDWYVALKDSGYEAAAGDTVSFGGWYCCTADGVKHCIKFNQKSYQFDGTKWTETTPTISVLADGSAIENNTIYAAPGQSVNDVTASASNGNAVTVNFGEAASDGKFVLRSGESNSDYLATFSVTDSNGVIYTKKVAVRVGFEDFGMENGAAVRVVDDKVNGLRFSAEMSQDTYNSLKAQDATFGIVIVPRDYITAGYELTAANLFGSNAKYSTTATAGVEQAVRRMVLLDNLQPSNRDNDSNYEIYGAITDILTNNLTREFVGVAYVCVNGEYIVSSYYGNDIENNARSIYYVSQRAIDANDHATAVKEKYIDVYDAYVAGQGKEYNVSYTVNYIKTRKGATEVESETISAPLNSVVEITARNYDGFSLTSGVAGVSLRLYANKNNVVDFYYKDVSLPDFENVAWHHPKLDATNDYMNDTNKAIAETMRDAGFTAVLLNGSATVGDLYLNSVANIEMMKNIINMFWTYGGVQTIVSGKNAGNTTEFVSLEDYQALETEMATLIDCEGFGGFFAWDEPLPNKASMDRIAEYAAWFDGLYGDKATFMTNLFPSYYDAWSSGEYTSYSAYIKAYCDIVLPNIVNGTKYLSMDSYPVNADGTLDQSFMYDIAVLKHYALQYGAQANAILQACGWDSDTHNVVPTEAQYRMMYYTALAFGMDSIGWWGYSPEKDEADSTILQNQTPVDINNNTTVAYDALKEVNTEVASFGPIYKTYTWQGVIMSSPSKGFIGIGKDEQYDAFNKVKSDSLLSSYMLSASNTSSFSSISGSGSNYVVSVMKDKNNNEAFTAVNYSAPKDNKTLSLTFKANVDGQYVIYHGGEQKEVTITESGYTLTLAPGEGAFIMSANTTHSVTFQNWDGSVLYETTCQVGNTPVYGAAEPTRDGYTFAGWTPALGAITGDTVYTATFKGMPTVTFQNWDGEVLQQSTWAYGATPVYSGATPTKEGCEFAGWTPEISAVTGDAVYTATFNEKFTVTYINANGTESEEYEEVVSGSVVDYSPTMDGYIFKGWTLNGEAYDMSEPITEDITLVATWYKKLDSGVDSVISAEYVCDNVQLEEGYAYKEEAASANPNAGWYFDSDYNGVTGAGGTVENQFAKRVKFTLTYDGGAGTSDTGRETYVILPAMNYKLYSKVDFAYENSGNIKAMTIYGTEVAHFGGNHKLISIVTDENGTKLYFREINSVGVKEPEAVIELPESVVNGSEGLRLNVTVGGWFKFAVTEFHVTTGAFDYMAEMDAAIAALESNPADADALDKYFENAEYMTAYEQSQHETPTAVLAAKETALYNAVVNAAAGSADQAAAIKEYSNFLEENVEAKNLEHIAVINAIIYENFYELEAETTVEYTPVIAGTGVANQGDAVVSNKNYASGNDAYAHFYSMKYQNGGNATFTLPAINYTIYAEVYFGIAAIVADNAGVITIEGQSTSFDNSHWQYYKVAVVGGVLTLLNDNADTSAGVGVAFSTMLSTDVLNGAKGLVISFEFGAYAVAEVTEMHVTALKMNETTVEYTPVIAGTGVANQGDSVVSSKNYASGNDAYAHFYSMKYQNGGNATFTLPAINYTMYAEVYFGIAAIVADNAGVITIEGQSTSFDNSHWQYYKVAIVGGVLTLLNDNADTSAGVGVAFSTMLSTDVLNGVKGLVISFEFGAYAVAEVTEIHALGVVRELFSSVVDNVPTILNATYQGEQGGKQYASGTYEINYQTLFRTEDNNNFDGTIALEKVTYNVYDEVYFGMYVLMDAVQWSPSRIDQTGVITINGQSWSITSNPQEHWYKVKIVDGWLTVMDDSTNNADGGAMVLKVALSEDILNGTKGLEIYFNFEAYAMVQTTNMYTVSWVSPIQ